MLIFIIVCIIACFIPNGSFSAKPDPNLVKLAEENDKLRRAERWEHYEKMKQLEKELMEIGVFIGVEY